MNIFDIIIAGAVVLAVGLAIAQIIKNKKNGKSCSCNCRGCTHNCKKKVYIYARYSECEVNPKV